MIKQKNSIDHYPGWLVRRVMKMVTWALAGDSLLLPPPFEAELKRIESGLGTFPYRVCGERYAPAAKKILRIIFREI